MYGDTTVIRALARRLREQAGEIRAEADLLVAHTEAVGWSGLAADAMRSMARDHAAGLRACATLHADAADALDRHASEVDRLVGLIAGIEHRVLGTLEHLAHHFVPPPHGSKEWLEVHVPRLW